MRHNKKAQSIRKSLSSRPDATVNNAGGLAFKMSPELELYKRACTGLFEDTYYKSGSAKLNELRALVAKCDRDFVLRLAAYARTEMNLRSLPVALLAEASRMPNTNKDSNVKLFTPMVCQRADEPAELVAYLLGALKEAGVSSGKVRSKDGLDNYKGQIPNQIKKGLASALSRFDEYQLAKYKGERNAVKLKDVIRIVHPSRKNAERKELYQKVLDGTLAVPQTWEAKISSGGSTSENWNEIAPNMGFMALLRNLRNFEQKGANVAIDIAVSKLTDPEAVRNSKQFPFRFLTAERHVTSTRLKDACREAVELSVINLPKWEGPTAIFCDLSGSMGFTPLSQNSSMFPIDIGSVMGAMACFLTKGEYLVGAFGQNYADVSVSRRDSILTNAQKIRNTHVGHSTNAHLCIDRLIRDKVRMKRVVILTDEECYSTSGYNKSLAESWTLYRRNVAPDAMLYTINLVGDGSAQFPEGESSVVQLAGWSDKVFNLINMLENSGSAVEQIKRIPVPTSTNFKGWRKAMREAVYSTGDASVAQETQETTEQTT